MLNGNTIEQSGYRVYSPRNSDFRAFFLVTSPRLTRSVVLPVSAHRMALRLAARLFDAFQKTRTVRREMPISVRTASLSQRLYDYVGLIYRERGREWATARTYKRNLEDLFRECSWRHINDVTADSFVRWRESDGRSELQHNRFLRDANAFFDEMTVNGLAYENPLRKIGPLTPLVAKSRNRARPEKVDFPISSDQLTTGNDLKIVVGGSTEKAADPSQGSGILKTPRSSPLHQTDNACAAALVAHAQPRIP